MRILILLSGVIVYLAVLLLFEKSAARASRLSVRLQSIEKQGEIEAAAENELNEPFVQRVLRPGVSKGIRWLGTVLPMSESSSKALSEQLRKAGSYQNAREYIASRIAVMGLAIAGVFLFSRAVAMSLAMTLYSVVITIFAVYTLARFQLTGSITQRKNQIENGMPDVMDLLSVSVSAGLGFDQALLYVVERCNGPLVDELEITQKEIALGLARAEALKRLSVRCDVEPLHIFVSAIIQAETLGIPISNVLTTQADNIRNLHRQKIEERAAKLPIKILLPLVFLVFPNLFLIVLGPAVPGILAAFGG